MGFISFFLVGLLLIALQTTILRDWVSYLGMPDLVFAYVAFIAFRFSWLPGLLLVAIMGWIMDVAVSVELGAYLMQYLLVWAALTVVTQQKSIKESVYQVPLTAGAFFICQIIGHLFIIVSDPAAEAYWSMEAVARQTMVMAIAIVPCFLFLNWFYERAQRRRLPSRLVKKPSGNRFR
ncbi:MAG: hypothetical protein N839_0015635 [Desulfofustis sp. PB-SRB1]|jgi:hypothetical protein|nr:hypothetical protein [Desulfofustis sp. PB-SRB1]MBM1003827.1 hypothetical protein [Desulfofustis sp. PB-SRB1]HBH29007.1 hypothetical protein [Desulfofustis sp.]